ncbi:MAG: hypothetical protein OEW08_02900 [Gammaproteobacteria bacterium]|nr:hypothetical protein [Gammaproteobacteria bacterium]
MNQRYPHAAQTARQRGYVLLLVLVLLSALMVGSVQFMARTATGAQISGTTRDTEETSLLAENAANLVLGRFMNGADLNGDTVADNTQLRINPNALDNAPTLPYAFIVSTGLTQGIAQTRPTLLQRIADGEAHGVAAPTDTSDYAYAPQILHDNVTQLRVQQLFATGAPLIFTATADGALITSATTWTEPAARKAAVWLELVRQPKDDAYIGIYVQATAQIGNTRAHLQRFGGFLHTSLLGNLATLTESSTHTPEMPPMAANQ